MFVSFVRRRHQLRGVFIYHTAFYSRCVIYNWSKKRKVKVCVLPTTMRCHSCVFLHSCNDGVSILWHLSRQHHPDPAFHQQTSSRTLLRRLPSVITWCKSTSLAIPQFIGKDTRCINIRSHFERTELPAWFPKLLGLSIETVLQSCFCMIEYNQIIRFVFPVFIELD